MMISDGAPFDEATKSANSDDCLLRHLRDVIEDIESRSSVELVAIGVGHDMTGWCRRARTIVDVGELGGAITDRLAELLNGKYHAFAPQFDEVIAAEDLCTQDELERLSADLVRQLPHLDGLGERLARRLSGRADGTAEPGRDFDSAGRT